jgi:hypothetical protein
MSQGLVARAHRSVPPVAWQERARIFCNYCQQRLLEGDNDGRAHLHDRGLNDETIRRWGLGWHEKSRRSEAAKWGLNGKRIYLPRGVIIPWTVDGATHHVKVRLFETWQGDTPKYIGVRGGRPTLHGLDHLEGKAAVVICEGELDAVLLHQEAGDLLDVVALGSKSAKVAPESLVHLLGASRWLLALDADAEDEAGVWSEYSARVKRVRPLEGNDLTDFHNAGGNLRAWVSHLLNGLGVEPSTGSPDPRDAQSLQPALTTTEQAEELLARADGGSSWAREWAELAATAGWSCFGMTWSEWTVSTEKQDEQVADQRTEGAICTETPRQ